MREAYQAGDVGAYNNLKQLKAGIDGSMMGLKDIDEGAYKRYVTASDAYHTFISKDFVDSPAGKLLENKDHHPRLTSQEATRLLWDNADDDTLKAFFVNFDNSREGLNDFLRILDEGKPVDASKAMDEFTAMSSKASKVLKDMAYSSLMNEFKAIDSIKGAAPVEVMRKVENILQTFVDKNKR